MPRNSSPISAVFSGTLIGRISLYVPVLIKIELNDPVVGVGIPAVLCAVNAFVIMAIKLVMVDDALVSAAVPVLENEIAGV